MPAARSSPKRRNSRAAMTIAEMVNALGINDVLAVGDRGPSWVDLPGVDGRKHALADLKEAKAVVVIFTCNHCPVASGYEDRLIRLTKDYDAKGVAVAAISVSLQPTDGLEK